MHRNRRRTVSAPFGGEAAETAYCARLKRPLSPAQKARQNRRPVTTCCGRAAVSTTAGR
ncbi:hypothetical protein SM879_004447 [Yersinia enterocolitica]|nr:hypothetical protein [Yersinia enterocolitica]ELY5238377.1 hypothetical protein [Yersinia enterocolitica]